MYEKTLQRQCDVIALWNDRHKIVLGDWSSLSDTLLFCKITFIIQCLGGFQTQINFNKSHWKVYVLFTLYPSLFWIFLYWVLIMWENLQKIWQKIEFDCQMPKTQNHLFVWSIWIDSKSIVWLLFVVWTDNSDQLPLGLTRFLLWNNNTRFLIQYL